MGIPQFRGCKKFEMEHETKTIMKSAPELYRRSSQNQNKENEEDDLQIDETQ